MAAVSLRDEILRQLEQLSAEQQQRVLDYARSLAQSELPPGTPGEVLLEHIGTFKFAPGALDEIAQAIEEDCERIDWGEW